MGLVHWFCNLRPIVTVCMQAQTLGSSQQAESASWVFTPVSMADGACAFVLQLKPHCHCMHASTNPWQLTSAESASWVITPISMADGACAFVLQLKPHCHCMHASTNPWQLTAAESASWVITTISMADGAYLLVLQLKPHCHCMHASTNPWQLTASRDCLLGYYTHLYGRWGLSIGFAT